MHTGPRQTMTTQGDNTMPTRAEIEAAHKQADARLDQLQPLMQQYEADALLDDGGKWSVRDCLSHVAASARVGTFGRRALDRLDNPPAPAAPGAAPFNIDEATQKQVEERKDKSIADLIAEAKEAHAASLEDLAAIDDASLQRKVPAARPGAPELSVGGTVLRMLEYHEAGQVDRIEATLRARTRWS